MDKSLVELMKELEDLLRIDDRLQAKGLRFSISEQINTHMQDKGISESEMAKRLGTSEIHVDRILRGEATFDVIELSSIAKALGEKVSVIIGGKIYE